MWTASPRRWWLAVLVLAALLLLLDRACGEDVRVGTFNIENYPKSQEQVSGAFALLASLRLDVIAVQEITDPIHFASTARSVLGKEWRFLHTKQGPAHRIGILFQRDRFRLLSVRERTETIVYDGAKPALEVRLSPREGGRTIRAIAVHLKAGGDNFAIRSKQLDALEGVLAQALETRDRVILLGDFNATGAQDRDRIEALANTLGIEWATERLLCTSFWDRTDGCFGSALDHILSSSDPDDVQAMGPCKTEGCDRKDRCPIYYHQISDHCPVVMEF